MLYYIVCSFDQNKLKLSRTYKKVYTTWTYKTQNNFLIKRAIKLDNTQFCNKIFKILSSILQQPTQKFQRTQDLRKEKLFFFKKKQFLQFLKKQKFVKLYKYLQTSATFLFSLKQISSVLIYLKKLKNRYLKDIS